MPGPRVTVVVPTLAGDVDLKVCLGSLGAQTFRDFEVVVVDNSGAHKVRHAGWDFPHLKVIEMDQNVGFGAAANIAWKHSEAPYLATLNDDAAASPEWLELLVGAMEMRSDAGMCASQVRLSGKDQLDSAGMLICRDGSSKQRGHLEPPANHPTLKEALLPSGSAALYRRQMIEQIGWFDSDFFLYCEDTDLGLRAQWAGWKCLYVPGAIVEHLYSRSSGGASPLKAYYVERNRLFVLIKNFPWRDLLLAPFVSLARYFWHLAFLFSGKGTASRFRAEGNSGIWLAWLTVRAHLAVMSRLPSLLRKRRQIRRSARISGTQFREILNRYSISAREVARL